MPSTSPSASRAPSESSASRFRVPLSTFAALAIGVLAIAASGLLALRAQERHADAAAVVVARNEQARQLDQIFLQLAHVETASRADVGADVEAARQALAVAAEPLEQSLSTVSPSPSTVRLPRLLGLIKQRLATVRAAVGGTPASPDRVLAGLVDDVRLEQAADVRAATAVMAEARVTARRTLLAGSAVLFVLFTVAGFLVVRDLLQRHRELWLRAGEAGVARAMLGDRQSGDVAGPVVRFLADYLGAVVGAFFTGSSATGFSLRGSYALADADKERAMVEGVTGQAVAARRALQVTGLSADYLAVTSSTGRSTAPTSLLVVPTIVDDEVNGVVELAFLEPLHGAELQLLERVSGAIGVGVRSAEYRRRLEDNLEETQRQAEEMQAQQEELRVNNEELEEQGRALRDAHARLEEQQNSLEENNEKLQAQTTVMAQQQLELARIAEEVVAKNGELERSSQYKSRFLANMSHELRTPLNSSLILAKLLAENNDHNLTDEQVKYAETIHAAGNDLLELINDVLDLAKIESGHVGIKPQPVAVSALSASMRRLFEPLAQQRRLDFKLFIKPDVPQTIETDALRVEQILKNLLSNAFKFTEQGGVTVVVSTSGDDVRFAVTDTGIGIAPDQHEVVFEAFRQIDDGSARKHGGTGLGLSISRDLATLLGGRLTLTSEVGHGSTFTLTLPTVAPTPLPVSPEPAPPKTTMPPPKPSLTTTTTTTTKAAPWPATAPSSTSERSILIVEDDAAFAAVLADVARSAGFQPLLAETADAAVELAVHHVPHAVLLDVRLPDHSGLAVLDRLKRTARTRHIPVHMISGVSDHARTAMVMGAVGYTMKPVQVEDLRLVLARLTDRADAKLKRVLVIEADPAQRESVRALLSHEGVEVSCAGSAHEARRHLQEHTYDCVVMDLSFPDESGQQLLQTMSQTADHAFPPVIVYTARTLSKNDEDALRQYSSSIIVKGARSPERLLDEVTLFLHQVESELPPERQRMLRHSRDREQLFEGRTLLIVEDDVRNIFALSRVLEPRGAKIEIARNGLEALAQLEAHPEIELVLMDVMMPEMDGLEAMRRIRQQSKWASLPIISLTAKAMRDDQEKCLAAGANDYVAKPIDVDKLLSLIRVWMPKR